MLYFIPLAMLFYTPFTVSAQVALETADSYSALGGPAVTCTDSVVVGDVGVDLGGAVTLTNCTVSGTVHEGDTVSQQAYQDFLVAYDALAQEQCDVNLTGQSLAGQFLSPGVYCFDAAVTETGGVLTLVGSSSDTWVFKAGTLGTGAFTATGFSVVMTSGESCSNNVYWWSAEAATQTDSAIIGSFLSGAGLTVTRGSLDGQALAKAGVTLTGTQLSVCGSPDQPPYGCDGKVTGGGQIPVPNADSEGRATFGFNARGNEDGTGRGHLNYVNHVTGLHVNGPVDKVKVIANNPDGSAKTVQFSGNCGQMPACAFSVTVEDHGEPGKADEFGIRVTGNVSEVRSQRVISRGNIKFHSGSRDGAYCKSDDRLHGKSHDKSHGKSHDRSHVRFHDKSHGKKTKPSVWSAMR